MDQTRQVRASIHTCHQEALHPTDDDTSSPRNDNNSGPHQQATKTHQCPQRQAVEVGASHGAPLRLDRLDRARRGTANLQVDGLQRFFPLGGLRRCLADITVLIARYACSPVRYIFRETGGREMRWTERRDEKTQETATEGDKHRRQESAT